LNATNATFSKSLHTNVGGQKHFLKGAMCPLFLPPAPAWVNITYLGFTSVLRKELLPLYFFVILFQVG
jgi:hypothetical protein